MVTIIHLSDLHLWDPTSDWFDWNRIHPVLRPLGLEHLIPKVRNADCLRVLRSKLKRLEARLESPPLFVVSGDIAAWPYPVRVLNEFCSFLTSEIPLTGLSDLVGLQIGKESLFTVLGNHDVWHRWGTGAYERSQFGAHLSTHQHRIEFRQVDATPVVTFHLNSSVVLIPPVGWISGPQITWLDRCFNALENGERTLPSGRNNPLSKAAYAQAIRLLILHHSPLEWTAYRDFPGYPFHQLFCRDSLVAACADHVDVLLFGHTHRAAIEPCGGMIAIDGGTVAAETIGAPLGDHHFAFHVLTFNRDRACQVEEFHFREYDFETTRVVPFYPTSAGYANAAPTVPPF